MYQRSRWIFYSRVFYLVFPCRRKIKSYFFYNILIIDVCYYSSDFHSRDNYSIYSLLCRFTIAFESYHVIIVIIVFISHSESYFIYQQCLSITIVHRHDQFIVSGISRIESLIILGDFIILVYLSYYSHRSIMTIHYSIIVIHYWELFNIVFYHFIICCWTIIEYSISIFNPARIHIELISVHLHSIIQSLFIILFILIPNYLSKDIINIPLQCWFLIFISIIHPLSLPSRRVLSFFHFHLLVLSYPRFHWYFYLRQLCYSTMSIHFHNNNDDPYFPFHPK